MAGLSRVEKIILSKLKGEEYNGRPLSRVEELLIDLNTTSGGDVGTLQKDVLQLKADLGVVQQHAILDSNYPDA